MKKNILYLGIAVSIGLLGGYLLFGNSLDPISESHDHTEATDNQLWTCSMHPQVMQPEPGDCPICGMDLIPAETSAEGLSANEIKMTQNAMALANIQTSVVGSDLVSDEDGFISLSGKITTNEENNAIQASYFDGRLERLYVNYEGQEIRRGQLLATIYAPTLVAAQQELITTASLKESQPALYNAVRNKLKLWKLTEKQINNIETSGKVQENFPIYATVSGTVAMVMAAEGDYVKQGQPILKVSNLTSVWATFDAYENQISLFKEGQKIKVTTNAYPTKEFDAVISFIDPVLNANTRTVAVRATLSNKENIFKPGMFVTGKIQGASTRDSSEILRIPASAVLWTGERSLVYIKTHPNEAVFEMREITLGTRNGDTYQVISGLENGDEIVTNGTFTVDAAAQLQGKKSMMNASGGKTMTGHEGHTGMQATANTTTTASTMEMELPKAFQTAFKSVLGSYFDMKDAFVDSDADQVSAFAKAVSKKIKAIDVVNLGTMEKSHLLKSIEMLDAIASTTTLENQRTHLVVLNEHIVALAMHIKSPSETLYVQKCPMANSNKGAIWLSTEKEIKNPYYGDTMLTCGSVIEEIK
ncbi:efflux RND transporter periplasmic adaptor subunit [uncultured Dokdonia sp.]|uniref:efflux RND transporter periplasmic adaptor subunit n=1 Tax=uncultured Dokdonia sp. TaxID=575653 RepID=UPI002621055A|nr:efflux RND transporter periplasmic adaptor subunit [uncultured Dokdonia sp.]